MDASAWLPTSRAEVDARGWDELDVVLVCGDAYVDHPAFGHAVIGRLLESLGLRVALLPQPNWRDDLRDFRKLGQPRLFFGISSGCMDPMVNHYTAARRRRSTDAYTPGGKAGFRPDYATTVYCQILKRLFPETPVIIGGIEASLRRCTHYDYWADRLLPSVLVSSGADLLVYGMGEQPLRQIVRLLQRGVPFAALTTVPQTALLLPGGAPLPRHRRWETRELAAHEDCLADKHAFARSFALVEREANGRSSCRLVQRVGVRLVVVNPPFPTMTTAELDASFDLPYTRLPHPRYARRGPIPAFEMIRDSITLHRGCFGGCSFCTIAVHQGRAVASRSPESVLREVERIVQVPGFKGYISDLGGPTANMYRLGGEDEALCARCRRPSCLYPRLCRNLRTDHGPLLDLYARVAAHPRVKKACVSSGIRYDLLVGRPPSQARADRCDEYLERLVTQHVSGRLKVAPEHTAATVLRHMRKPPFALFRLLADRFAALCGQAGLDQQLIPYFMSGHPGCRLEDMAELAAIAHAEGWRLEQVQEFTPTPMTRATVMYYTGLDPETLGPVFVARSPEQKRDQHRFFFWYKEENRAWIRATLVRLGRGELAASLVGRHGSRRPQPRVGRAPRV